MSTPSPVLQSEHIHDHAHAPERAIRACLSVWFDMQPDADARTFVPYWARTLAQAHVDGRWYVLAHPDSAYAQSGLMCEVVRHELWPNAPWLQTLVQTLTQTLANHPLSDAGEPMDIALMLPYRASPVLWAQWARAELPAQGIDLDRLSGLLQGTTQWQETLTRADASRWLVLDQVVSYGKGHAAEDFIAPLRAFNPLVHWWHDVPEEVLSGDGNADAPSLLQPLNAHAGYAPLSRISLKNSDLDAWHADKVLYLSFLGAMNAADVTHLLQQWRIQHSNEIVRAWGVIGLADAAQPLLIDSIHHAWRMQRAQPQWLTQPITESRFWLLGKNIDRAAMTAQWQQCATLKASAHP